MGIRPNYGDGANYWSVSQKDRGSLPLESYTAEEYSPVISRALMLLQGLCRAQLRPLENWSYFRPLVCDSILMRKPWPVTAQPTRICDCWSR